LFLPDFSGRNEREQNIPDSLYFYGMEKGTDWRVYVFRSGKTILKSAENRILMSEKNWYNADNRFKRNRNVENPLYRFKSDNKITSERNKKYPDGRGNAFDNAMNKESYDIEFCITILS